MMHDHPQIQPPQLCGRSDRPWPLTQSQALRLQPTGHARHAGHVGAVGIAWCAPMPSCCQACCCASGVPRRSSCSGPMRLAWPVCVAAASNGMDACAIGVIALLQCGVSQVSLFIYMMQDFGTHFQIHEQSLHRARNHCRIELHSSQALFNNEPGGMHSPASPPKPQPASEPTVLQHKLQQHKPSVQHYKQHAPIHAPPLGLGGCSWVRALRRRRQLVAVHQHMSDAYCPWLFDKHVVRRQRGI